MVRGKDTQYIEVSICLYLRHRRDSDYSHDVILIRDSATITSHNMPIDVRTVSKLTH